MLTDYVRERISQMAREAQSLPARRATGTIQPLTLAGRDLPAGCEVRTELGHHWQIEQSLFDLWPDGKVLIDGQQHPHSEYRDGNSRDGNSRDGNSRDRLAGDQVAFRQSFPHTTVLLDLETCGFAGSMIFLVGLLHETGRDFVLTQLFARDYSEEPAVLASLAKILTGKRVLATFNGKSFDWPMICDRATIHRIDVAPPITDHAPPGATETSFVHFDLLHHARRRFADVVPDCRLTTLEQDICHRRRVGDIPGGEIPAAYHDFVRNGDATQMHSVLHHNAMDLVTLLELALKITTPKCER